jgi:hypothetical protein
LPGNLNSARCSSNAILCDVTNNAPMRNSIGRWWRVLAMDQMFKRNFVLSLVAPHTKNWQAVSMSAFGGKADKRASTATNFGAGPTLALPLFDGPAASVIFGRVLPTTLRAVVLDRRLTFYVVPHG